MKVIMWWFEHQEWLQTSCKIFSVRYNLWSVRGFWFIKTRLEIFKDQVADVRCDVIIIIIHIQMIAHIWDFWEFCKVTICQTNTKLNKSWRSLAGGRLNSLGLNWNTPSWMDFVAKVQWFLRIPTQHFFNFLHFRRCVLTVWHSKDNGWDF